MDYRLQYSWHKYDAIARGIPFAFSYEEWLKVWIDSGHLHERGHKRGQYCMARFNDQGPYAVWNVKIVTCTENISEGQLGKPKSQETKRRMSKPKSPEHRAKIAQRNKERAKRPEEHIRLVALALKNTKARSVRVKGLA